jgi:hypothetical protein
MVGMALRRMLAQHFGELRQAARILVLERLTHRRVRVFRGRPRDAFLAEHLARFRRQRLHGIALYRVRH